MGMVLTACIYTSPGQAGAPQGDAAGGAARARVHTFRGVPQGRAAGAWDAHAALMDRSRDRYS
eukprot:scaffold9453_cov27-Phaeocystis_antarctica.AAC.1